MKENWTDLHADFAKTFFPNSDKTLQNKWEEKGFDFKETKKWVEIGFKPKEELNKVVYMCLPYYWKKNGFTIQQTYEWIKTGLKRDEFDLAYYLQKKGFSPRNINLFEERKKKIEVQEWLETLYPSERKKNTRYFMLTNEKRFSGNLVVNDWENLDHFYCENNDFSSLEITNCPKLEKVFAKYNKLVSFSIDNCPQIVELHLDYNKLKDLTCFSNLNDLKILSIRGNNFTSGLEYLPTNVEKVHLIVNQLKDYKDDYQSWRKDYPELIIRAQEVLEWEEILTNLRLALVNQLLSELTDQALQIFIFQGEERIKELKKELEEIKEEKLATKIEVLPK